MSERLEEFKQFREEMNARIMDSDNLNIKRFFNLDTRAYEEGALSSKTKELMGLVASMVLRCDDCITYHLDRCYEAGIEREELLEAFNISLIVGGSIVIPHLRRALAVLEELENASPGAEDDDRSGTTPIKIYTDGACYDNPGPGGYAAVIIDDRGERRVSGFEEETTNNRMELKAVIQALKTLDQQSMVEIYSDSNYVIQGISSWLDNWEQNGWKTSGNRPVKNQDLWQELNRLRQEYQLEFVKVKAHTGDHYNEEVDSLAKKEIKVNLD
ncbi:MAG: ribonuclease HI [Bacillota bacterium]